ncbi:MAG: substrate-binding domain-containing protein [Chloroflexi bacterium]|nr:substrate-binding domain-containing protein [Chloroflexota bacterium]
MIGLLLAAACGSDSKDHARTPSAGATTAAAASPAPTKASGTLILATTTSTQDSGLLDVLVPMFEKESGYTVKTVAVGSGQAIEQASRGDADVVLVHSPAAEKTMVDNANGIERALVMHNDFIIVGSKDDPAGRQAAKTTNDAMGAIAAKQSRFISRGDNSGTNALELKLWKAITIDPKGQSWYEESGQGMGATLQIANQKAAYTISDRATYLAQKKNLDLVIVFEKDRALLNVYHVIVVNPAKHANVKVDAARAFAAFMVRADVQKLIGEFGVATAGEPLFVPDAGKPEPAG